MRFEVIGIGDYIGKCVYDEAEDALIVQNEVVLDFKKEKKDYLRYTKFLINTINGRSWVSFQFLPKEYMYLERKFAVITAYNPKNLVLNEFLNFLRNTELEAVLKAFGYEYFMSIGDLFYYNELSFIVYGIELEEAVKIALKFDQHSIFYNSAESISIIECESKKEILKYDYKKHYKT